MDGWKNHTSESVAKLIDTVSGKFTKLLVIVGPSHSGKTQCLKEISEKLKCPYFNAGVELAKRLIELSTKQREIRVSGLVKEIIDTIESDVVLVDNTELLFNPDLKTDPVRLFVNISRNKTLVVSINGKIINHYIVYAEENHPEYQKFQIEDYEVMLIGS